MILLLINKIVCPTSAKFDLLQSILINFSLKCSKLCPNFRSLLRSSKFHNEIHKCSSLWTKFLPVLHGKKKPIKFWLYKLVCEWYFIMIWTLKFGSKLPKFGTRCMICPNYCCLWLRMSGCWQKIVYSHENVQYFYQESEHLTVYYSVLTVSISSANRLEAG
jgi:hypothetical protein